MIQKFINSQLCVYITRVLIGFIIGYSLYIKLPEYQLFWTLISIILVISPEGKDSRRLSIERFKSNFVGSSVGLLCLLIHPTNVYMIVGGILFTCIICQLFNIINMARVALVALLIVLIQSHVDAKQLAPIMRFASVSLGCIIGLLVTVCTSMLIRKLKGSQEPND